MSAQRTGSAVEAGHRSIHPNIPGVPWWGALLIATIATAVGYAIDAGSGHKELTHVFAVFYIAGCVAAVLAVRQEGVFTAIIQPPLILFFAVPGAYWLFHGRKVSNLKDLLINCGYPLIERFPLMLGTAGGVLLVGLVRWYFGAAHRSGAADTADDPDTGDTARPGKSHSFTNAIGAKLNSLLGLAPHDDDSGDATGSKRTRADGTARKGAARTGRTARSDRSAGRPSRSHSRHARPRPEDEDERTAERPRRRRPVPPRDAEPADPPRRPRRRPRPEGDRELRGQPPRESRRDPPDARRDPYERPAPRGSSFDGYDTYEPPYEPRPRRGTSGGANGTPTHHPISRVRYRGEAHWNEPRAERRAEPRADRHSRSRPFIPPAESWEYDV